jgi:hypothetical protein
MGELGKIVPHSPMRCSNPSRHSTSRLPLGWGLDFDLLREVPVKSVSISTVGV